MKKQAESWLSAAKDDLDVIKEIIGNEHLTNMVAFHAQQAIEKSFKAVLEEKTAIVPRVHSIILLRSEIKKYLSLDIDKDIFDQLNELYIDARYPAEIGLLPTGKPSLEEARGFYTQAENIFLSIKDYLN